MSRYTTSDWKIETTGLRNQLAKRGVNLEFEGDEIKTNGNTIYLPDYAESLPLPPRELSKLRGYLDHEAAHVVHTNFRDHVAWVKANSGCGQEVLQKKANLFNLIEDTRIERKAIREYPGSHKNFTEAVRAIDGEVSTDSDWNSMLSGIFQGVRREEYGLELSEDRQKLLEKHKEVTDKIIDALDNAKSSRDIHSLVDKIYKEYEDPEHNPPPPDYSNEPEEGEGEGSGDNPDGAGDGGGQAKAMKELSKLLAGSPGIGDNGEPSERELEGELPEGNNTAPYRYSPEGDLILMPINKLKDTEWGRYSCYDLGTGKFKDRYGKALHKVGTKLNTAKALFRRALLSRDTRGWERGREVGLLDSKRFVQAVSGLPNIRKVRDDIVEYDTAVHILIDCSGSMFGTPLQTAFECMVVLTECMKGTPVKLAISGHTTFGVQRVPAGYARAEKVVMPLFKDYDQALPSSIKDLGDIFSINTNQNADACAVRYAMDSLKKRKESKKLLIVLSDGYPAVKHTLHGARYSCSRAHQKEIQRIQAHGKKYHGVQTVGIGILVDHVAEFYEEAYPVHSLDEFTASTLKILAKKILMDS